MTRKICSTCHDKLDKKIEQKNKTRDINLEQNIKKKIEIETQNLNKEFNDMIKKEIIHENSSYGETEEIICDSAEKQETQNKQKHNRKNIYDTKNVVCSVTCKYSNYFLLGSGFLVKRNKTYYVVTCAHIISEEPENENKKIYIDLQSGNGQIICEIVGLDKAADIAVLRPLSKQENKNEGYDISNQQFVKFGNSTTTKPGTKCYIIGNAYGTDPFSISDGVVRDNKFVFDLQTESMLISAPTWVGNSGSPIFNDECNVIGMVSHSFRNEDNYESTLIGGSTQYMLENITRLIIDAYDDNIKGFLGIKKFVTMSDIIFVVIRQMFPDLKKDKLKGLLILDLDENIKSTENIQKLDILLEITNPVTKEKIDLGCFDDQYHFSRLSWFQRIGYPIEAKLLRPLDNTIYNTVFVVIKLPDEYDNLFGNSNSLNKKVNVGLKNYVIKSLSNKIKTRDLFDFI